MSYSTLGRQRFWIISNLISSRPISHSPLSYPEWCLKSIVHIRTDFHMLLYLIYNSIPWKVSIRNLDEHIFSQYTGVYWNQCTSQNTGPLPHPPTPRLSELIIDQFIYYLALISPPIILKPIYLILKLKIYFQVVKFSLLISHYRRPKFLHNKITDIFTKISNFLAD